MRRCGESTALIVFARAPVPGRVKTRLIPALGIHGAVSLYRQMLHQTLVTACQAGFAGVELCCAPDSEHDFFRDLAGQFPIKLSQQQGPELGSRMYHALSEALQRHNKAILIGSDCPYLQVDDLLAAQARLSPQSPLVLGPAKDGGYFLIGARKLDSGLFSDVPWGTPEVLDMTRRRLRELGWKWQEIRALQDIDRPEDLTALADCFELEPDISGEVVLG